MDLTYMCHQFHNKGLNHIIKNNLLNSYSSCLNGGDKHITLLLLPSQIHYSPSSGTWLSLCDGVGKATVAMVMRKVKVATEKRCGKRRISLELNAEEL